MSFLIWAVFGGFILHFLLSNYLSILLQPTYEKSVESAQDVLERNLIPGLHPGGEYYIQLLAGSPDPNYQELSRIGHILLISLNSNSTVNHLVFYVVTLLSIHLK